MNHDPSAESSFAPRRTDRLVGLPPQPRRRRSRRSKSARHPGAVSRVHVFLAVLATGLTVGALAFLAIQALRSQVRALQNETTRLEHLLAASGDQIETLRSQRDDLVAERIPGLQALTFDETISIENAYLRYIIFTRTVREGRPAYEFRAVLHNNSRGEVVPDVSVRLFDELGIQVGTGQIYLDTLAMNTGSSALGSGDVQSYSGNIEVSDPGQPAYYVIRVD